MSESAIYEGKPTVYLDQNVLDVFVKNGLGEFGNNLIKNFQIVYSDETLKEIQRSTGYEKQFLDVLNELSAWHLKVVLDNSFQPTGKATISDRDVYETFSEYINNDPVFENICNSMLQSNLKIFGGRENATFDDLKNEQLVAYEKLHEYMLNNIDVLKETAPELASEFELKIHKMKTDLEFALEESSKHLYKHAPEPVGWSGIKDYRGSLELGPIQLNNIEPPNVLEQIWNKYKEKLTYDELNWELEDFFGIKINPIYPDSQYFDYQKVNSIYTHLNMIGYHPDSKVHKERRFVAAVSDQGHASLGTFSDFLLSRDESFVIKARAAYEYLGVQTQVMKVDVQYA